MSDAGEGGMTFIRDRLQVVVFGDREMAGSAAGRYAAARLRDVLSEQEIARVIFAAAPSQLEMLDTLARASDIDWRRVIAFHLDDYVALPPGHPSSFAAWLERTIWSRVHPGRIERIDGNNPDGPQAEAQRYGALLAQGGIDLALIGVGENGHVAFNEPHVADFDDPLLVKPVDIDEVTRNQQVRDGGFANVEEVPRLALTITMPVIRDARVVCVVVPGPQKASAIGAMLDGPVSTACPASLLRRHADARAFLDQAAASLVQEARLRDQADA